MSQYKIGGCCSSCDAPVYEVRQVGDRKRFGSPHPDATRVEFLLFNGGRTSMTFCGPCAASVQPEQYTLLWQKNLNGYMREQGGNTEKFKDQFANGLLCELGRFNVKELIANGN